jgi:hypothetical protein
VSDEPQKAFIMKQRPKCRDHHEKSEENNTPEVVKWWDIHESDDVDGDQEHAPKRLCTRHVDDAVAALVAPSAVSSKPCACLTFENGETFQVQEGTEFTIGRDPNSNFLATDLRVSGKHCKISYKDGVVTLEDTSSGGTWVFTGPNFLKLLKSKKELTSGDRVLIYYAAGEKTATNAAFNFTLI